MNRVEIKEKAKKIVQENLKTFWAGYGIILAITCLLSFGIDLLFSPDSMIYNVLTLVVSCFSMTLSVGFYSYLLKIVRNEQPSREDIFKYIGQVLPIIAISILIAVFCFFWSILFIIPGIIAAISYSFAYLIYADDNSLSPMEYLTKSKEMLKGYKADYFVFCLSFFGWILLSIFIFPLIWTIPYYMTAEVIYYDELKKLKSNNN